jgi:hypothetical protein
MSASENNLISVSDYNAIRNIAASIMGVGSGSRGYGQLVYSRAKSQNQLVSQTDWDNLRLDLLNARLHQSGSGSLAEINEDEKISASTINLYESLRTTVDNNRFVVAAGQFLTTGANPDNSNLVRSRNFDSNIWLNEISAILTVTFLDSNSARYFFNSGGTIRIKSSRTGTAQSKSDAQNTSWTTLLNAAGLREFGGQIPDTGFTPLNGKNFYKLTNTFQEYSTASSSSPYGSNRYVLEARSNVANNANGTANQVFIRIRFIDGYVDPGRTPPNFPVQDNPNTDEGVAGTFTIEVSEKRADGSFLPSGDFKIARPTYSISDITGS